MGPEPQVGGAHVTEGDLADADRRMRSSTRGVVPLSLLVEAIVIVLAGYLVNVGAPELRGMAFVLCLSGVTVAVTAPLVLIISAIAAGRSRLQLAQSFAREREMGDQSRRREFETRLANALEMAENEEHVLSAARRALARVLPDASVEVLLADNSHAHLQRSLVSGPNPAGPGCQVESPDRCVAARRGQTQEFADSDEMDACPHLQHRAIGQCRAVCVPVSIMGRTVGVVHRAEPIGESPAGCAAPAGSDPSTRQLEVLANQMGARIGMLRVMAESQLQASTDPVTGLPNRRSFENRVRRFATGGIPYALVLIDLDNFKQLNDTYGHEAGDRALRVFSSVLRDGVRPDDLVCRYGGEEFAIALPNCPAEDAVAACERLRESLALAIQAASAPRFTASFGIAMSPDAPTADALVARADAALYRAKSAGRNQTVLSEAAPT